MENTIGFIGAGNMGRALIRGILDKGIIAPEKMFVSLPHPEKCRDIKEAFPGLNLGKDNRGTAQNSRVLVLAVKPGLYRDIIRETAGDLRRETIVVSIAAGLRLETMEGWLGKPVRLIRAMPNTPSLAGAGMTALCPGAEAREEDVDWVRTIFESVGKTVTLPSSLMDPFTALAGSSPAWVFLFLEAMADGAVREGIPRNMAYEIAAQAVMGSAKLVLETGEHPGVLKDQVCSPGGATIEAVAALESAGFRSSVIQAMGDCVNRARDMGKEGKENA